MAAVILRTLSATDTEALEQVRQYFRNYAGWLGVDLSYQNFDQEMASLPGAYSRPEGRLFFAEVDGRPAGCVGVRPLSGSEGVCEMKRLYVTPEERGHGVGAALALAAIKAAKEIGYRKLMLDTLPNMRMAVKLYRELGFTEHRPTTRRRSKARCSSRSIWKTGRRRKSATRTSPTCSTSTAPGPARCGKSIRPTSTSWPACRPRNYCGSAAPTRACRPTRSSACCRAKSSSIATSPTSSCIPISTACRSSSTRSMC